MPCNAGTLRHVFEEHALRPAQTEVVASTSTLTCSMPPTGLTTRLHERSGAFMCLLEGFRQYCSPRSRRSPPNSMARPPCVDGQIAAARVDLDDGVQDPDQIMRIPSLSG